MADHVKTRTILHFVNISNKTSALMKKACDEVMRMSFDVVWHTFEDCLAVTVAHKQLVYVFEDFTGPAFEHLSKLKIRIYGPTCILQCLQRNERLPLEAHPVMCLTMKNVLVCCSSVTAEIRDGIYRRVQYMNGKTSKDYIEAVTHLVAGEAGSKKYYVAASLHRNIVLPEWIDAVWEHCRFSPAAGLDDVSVIEFKCPVFRGFVISVSGLDTEERNRVKDVIEANGGRYSGEMKYQECTHLVVTVAGGNKFAFAVKWKINIVTPDWLFDSVAAGYTLQESGYSVSTKGIGHEKRNQDAKTSTQNNSLMPLMSNTSSIGSISAISVTHIDDTALRRSTSTTLNSTDDSLSGRHRSSGDEGDRSLARVRSSSDEGAHGAGEGAGRGWEVGLDELDALDLRACKSDAFLDNCKIFVWCPVTPTAGFSTTIESRLEKVKRLINLGGATRHNEINNIVTHIILLAKIPTTGNDITTKRLIEASTSLGPPHTINVRWLVECFRYGVTQPTEPFCVQFHLMKNARTTLEQSLHNGSISVSGKEHGSGGTRIDGDHNFSSTAAGSKKQASKNRTLTSSDNDGDDEMQMLLSQYLPSGNGEGGIAVGGRSVVSLNGSLSESALVRAAEEGSQNKTVVAVGGGSGGDDEATLYVPPAVIDVDAESDKDDDETKDAEDEDNDITQDVAQVQENEPGLLFDKRTFLILGMDGEDEKLITSMIEQYGGRILSPLQKRQIGDYAVVPIFGCDVNVTVGSVVTNAWIQMCVDEERLIAVESRAIFSPILIKPDCRPLVGCVLSISGYSGVEREVLVLLSNTLGALCQDYFVKRPKNELLASTHLVVATAEGSKFEAAIKWGLPAITCQWLFECARVGRRVDEVLFSVTNPVLKTIENDRTSVSAAAAESAVTTADASKAALTMEATRPECRLSSSKTRENLEFNSDIPKSVFKEPLAPPRTTTTPVHPITGQDGRQSTSAFLLQSSNNNNAVSAVATNGAKKDSLNGPAKENHVIVKPIEEVRAGKSDAIATVPEDDSKGNRSKLAAKKALLLSALDNDFDIDIEISTKHVTRNAVLTSSVEVSRDSKANQDHGRLGKSIETDNLLTSVIKSKPTSAPIPSGNTTQLLVDINSRLFSSDEGARKSSSNSSSSVVEAGDLRKSSSGGISSGTSAGEVTNPDGRVARGSGGKAAQFLTTSSPVTSSERKTSVIVLTNSRVEELRQDERSRPVTKTDATTPKAQADQSGLDMADLLRQLATPEVTPRTKLQKQKLLENPSPALDEVFAANISLADKLSGDPAQRGLTLHSTSSQDLDDYPTVQGLVTKNGPLHDVVIAVCKKLSEHQSEYNNIADALGADYLWTYDNSCTHFIFQGRQNDTNKEFRTARDHKKFVVSPHWLYACREQNEHVQEMLYPHTYNPNMSLNLTSQKTPARRPLRTTRAAAAVLDKARTPCGAPKPAVAQASASPVAPKTPGQRNSSSSGVDRGSSSDSAVGAEEESLLKGEGEDGGEEEGMNAEEGFDSHDTTQSDEDIARVCDGLEDQQKTSDQEDVLMNGLKRMNEALKSNSKKRPISRTSSFQSPNAVEQDNSVTGGGGADAKPRPAVKMPPPTRPRVENYTQPSQIVEVTWDDPAAREQRAMLASDLAKDSESISPYRRPQTPPPASSLSSVTKQNTLPPPTSVVSAPNPPSSSSSRSNINFGAPLRSVPPPHQVTMVTATTTAMVPSKMVEQKSKVTEDQTIAPFFLFSGFQKSERDELADIVESLGGQTLDCPDYNVAATHLVVNVPVRNEKFLAFVAAGKWVLHRSYLDACKQQRSFVGESDFEWGSKDSAEILRAHPPQSLRLAEAAHRWRVTLAANVREKTSGSPSGQYGAFKGWRVLLYTDVKREANFRRLLEAGGAIVISNKESTSLEGVTHVFMEPNKINMQLDLEAFVRAAVPCIRPEYIASFITEDPSPSPSGFYVPDVAKLMSSSTLTEDAQRKRKPSSTAGLETLSKKSR